MPVVVVEFVGLVLRGMRMRIVHWKTKLRKPTRPCNNMNTLLFPIKENDNGEKADAETRSQEQT